MAKSRQATVVAEFVTSGTRFNMAHFAKIENDTVTQVIVVSNDDCGGGDFPESEPIGQAFIASLGLTGEWLQTSYHAILEVAGLVQDLHLMRP
jgi:hypothetical protein